MEGTKEGKGLKKFTCPKCGCNHIINSDLDIQHSYYTESEKKNKEVENAEGVQDSKTPDGKEDSGKIQSEGTSKEEKKTDFEREVSEDQEKNKENDWGWDNW